MVVGFRASGHGDRRGLRPAMSVGVAGDARLPVSVVLPVLNEEENLSDALASVAWASEVFVVDSGSSDRTCEIAHEHGATVVQFAYQQSGPKKKAWALRNLPFAYEWAFFLDGDERVTPELQGDIARVVASPDRDAYYVDREFVFRGKLLRCYRPDWNLRLFRHALAEIEDLGMRDVADTGDNEIHEHFVIAGRTGFLEHALLHDDYRGIGPWIDRHNKYATWEAHLYAKLRRAPISASVEAVRDPIARNRLLRRLWARAPARPLLRFIVWYVAKRGFLDGVNGLIYSVLMAWYELLIGLKLAELEASSSPAAQESS